MANICKNGNRQITKNFIEKEFYSKSVDAPECHYLDDNTIKAVQAVRDYYNVPIRITSTMRTAAGNAAVGGVSNSRHLDPAQATDFQFVENPNHYLSQFYNELKCKGPLYRKLRQIGINGMGIYGSFVHLDTRDSIVESFWDESAGKYGDTRITTRYMVEIPESGLNSSECAFASEEVRDLTDSKYGLTGIFAPLDPSNYSGQDGIKSQEAGLTRLLVLGSVLVIVGGIFFFRSRKKSRLMSNTGYNYNALISTQ